MKKFVFSLLVCATWLGAHAQVTQLPVGFTSVLIVRAGACLSMASGGGVEATKIDSYRNYDFGVLGGIGFWFGHFNNDLNYQRGFVSIYEGDN